MRSVSFVLGLGLLVVATTFVEAKQKPRQPEPKVTCGRAAYPGDPVCGTGEDHNALPLPSSRLIRHHKDSSGFVVKDGVSVDGKTNFNENRYGEAPLDKLTPRPSSKASTNGGAQLDFRF